MACPGWPGGNTRPAVPHPYVHFDLALAAAPHSGPQTSPLRRQSRSICMIAGKDELLGPKINGNPEHFEHHILIRHECAEQLTDTPCDFDSLAAYLHARTILTGCPGITRGPVPSPANMAIRAPRS